MIRVAEYPKAGAGIRYDHHSKAASFLLRVALVLFGLLFLLVSFARADFVDNGNGTVTNTDTGLTWQQLGSESQMTWEEALNYASSLDLAGCTDWRVPNRKELQSIVDRSQRNPAIDSILFPQTHAEFYWSSSKKRHSGLVWGVEFYKGRNSLASFNSPHYVRVVSNGCSLDFTPPELLATDPAAAAAGQSVAAAITATFSENIDPATVVGTSFNLGAGVSGSLSLSGAVATFTPAAPLDYNTSYTATIVGSVADMAGNPLGSDYVWTFTTETAPDSVPPVGSISIDAGAIWSNDLTVELSLAATDGSGTVAEMRFSNDNATWSSWEAYGMSKIWELAVGDGNKSVYVQFRDPAGNVSSSASDNILLDTFAPTIELTTVATPTDQFSQTIGGAVEAGSLVVVTPTEKAGTVTVTGGSWTCNLSGLVEGSNSLTISASDTAGNSTEINTVIVVDTSDQTPPVGSISIAAGKVATNQTTVVLDLSASDNSGSVDALRFSTDGISWGAWETPLVAQKDWNISAGDGIKTVYVQYRDAAGNVSAIFSDSIELDTLAPAIFIDSVNTPTSQSSQTLTGTTEADVVITAIADTAAIAGSATNAAGDWSFDLSGLVGGNNQLTVVATDAAGNSAQQTTNIYFDNQAPIGSVIINGGDAATASATVSLTMAASDDLAVAEMRAANAGGAWTAWEAYESSKAWQLSDGNGSKSVSVQFRDSVGNVSADFSDDILLDTVVPELTVVNENSVSNLAAVNLAGTMEANSTLTVVTDSPDLVGTINTPTATSWDVQISPLPEGTTTVTITLTDSAGNQTSLLRTFTYDSQPPTGSLAINYGADYTGSGSVTLNLDATDITSGVEKMQLRDAGGNWSDWLDYAPTYPWELPGSDGSKTVEVQYLDSAGNLSAIYTDAILLDRTEPLVAINALSETLTNNPSLLLSGSRELDANISVALPGGSVATVEYPTASSWQVSLTLAEGSNNITVTATDNAGNNASAATSLVLDSVVALTVNPPQSPTNLDSQLISGSREADAIITLSVPASLAFPTSTSWEATVSGLTEDNNPIIVTAEDGLGNSAAAELNIVLDLIPPTGSLMINNAADLTGQQNVLLLLAASDNVGPIARVRFQNENLGWSDWVFFSSMKSWSLSGGDAEKTVSAQVEDAAGNVSTFFSDTILLDTSAPSVTIDAVSSPTQVAGQQLSGTMEAGSSVVVNAPGGLAGGVSYPDSQSWQATINLLEGNNNISVVATDTAGNRSSVVASIVLDTVAQVSISSVASPTNMTSQLIGGSREANAAIELLLNDSAVPDVTYPTATSWNCQLSGLQEGANQLTVNAVDGYGNPGSAVATIVVDTVLPSGSLIIKNGAAQTNSIFVTLKLTVSDNLGPIEMVRFSNDGISWGGWNVYKGTWPWSLAYGEGDKTVAAQVKDAAGNISPLFADSIELDTIGPLLTLAPVTTPTGLGEQTISGTTEAGATVNVGSPQAYEGAVTVAGIDWSCPLTLAAGTNSINLEALDAAGNKTSLQTSILLDQSSSVTISPFATPSNQASQIISGRREIGATVTLVVDTAATVGAISYPSTTSWQASVTGLLAGDNTFTAEATDGFGNTDSATRLLVIDLTPPEVNIDPFAELGSESVRTLTGRREIGDVIDVTSPQATLLNLSYDGTAWQATISLIEGGNGLTVIATDFAGNTSSQLVSMTLDSTAEVSIDSYSALSNVSTQTIGGYLEPNSSLQLAVDTAAVLGQVQVDGDRWSCDIDLTDGPNVVTATAIDSLGNQTSVTRTLSLDTEAPSLSVAPVTSPTRDWVLVLNGSVEPGATVTVVAPGATVFPASVIADAWQCTLDLPDGVTAISVTATDGSGNQSSVETSIEVDTQVLLSIDPFSSFTNNPTVTLTGEIEPGFSAFDFSSDTAVTFGDLQIAESGWQRPLTLAEGENTISLTATDALGNRKEVSQAVTLDTQVPTVTIDPLSSLTTEAQLVLSGSRSLDGQVSLSIPGATVLSTTVSGDRWEASVSLHQGDNNITVTATDAAGNSSSANAAITLDSQAQLTFNALAWNQSPTHVVSQTVSGTVELDSTLVVELTGGGSYGPLEIAGGSWSCPITLVEGSNSISVTATDPLGNSDTISHVVILDSLPPAAVPLTATNTFMGGEVVLDWSGYDSQAEGVSLLRVYVSEEPISSLIRLYPVRTLVDPVETSLVLTGLEDNRDWYFTIVASDAAGNISPIAEVSAVPTLQGFQGFVTDSQSGEPLLEAVIDVAGQATVTTNANGYYRLAGLPAGSYDLSISGGGYQLAGFNDMPVHDGEMSRIDIALMEEIVEPSVPQNLSAAAGDTLVTINWAAVSDADLIGYNLYRLLSPTDSAPVQLNSQPITGTSFVDMDLNNGEHYYYLVRSINQAGTLSGASELVSAVPQAAPPEPAAELAAILNPDNSVTLLWSKSPTENVSAYNIYWDNGSGVIDYANSLATVSAPGASLTTQPLTAEATYYFGLRTVKDGSEEQNLSLVVSLRVTNVPITSPRTALTKPLAGEHLTGNRITLQADLISGSVGEIKHVLFQYRPVAEAAWRDVPAATVSQPNPDPTAAYSVRWDVTKLKGGYFELRAVATAAADGAVDPAPKTVIVAIDHKKPTWQEWKNEKVKHKLKRMVKRGRAARIELEELVAGETFSVDLPEASLASDTEILAEIPNQDEFADTLSGLDSIDRFLRLQLDSGQTEFDASKLVEIKIPYPDLDNDGIVDGTNINESKLQLLWLNRETGRWEHSGIVDLFVDVAANVITGRTSHFTDFGVVGVDPLGVSIESPVAPVNSSAPMVSGSVTAGASVSVSLTGAGSVGTVTYPTAGSWQCSLSGLVEGQTSVTAIADDGQGGVETASLTLTVDLTLPVGTISVNGGSATTNSNFVVLSLTSADQGSSVVSMQFRNETGAWSTPVPVASTWSWDLSVGSGTKTVSVQYVDTAGNASAIYSDTIELLSLPPAPVQPGTPVTVNPDPDVQITFTEITTGGEVTANGAPGLTPPAGFEALEYTAKELTTTAGYSGPVEVCLDYRDADLKYPSNESQLKLMHHTGILWEDITTLVNPVANVVCGQTSTFSPFVIVETPSADGASAGPARVPVMQGWWLLLGMLTGLGVLVRRLRVS